MKIKKLIRAITVILIFLSLVSVSFASNNIPSKVVVYAENDFYNNLGYGKIFSSYGVGINFPGFTDAEISEKINVLPEIQFLYDNFPLPMDVGIYPIDSEMLASSGCNFVEQSKSSHTINTNGLDIQEHYININFERDSVGEDILIEVSSFNIVCNKISSFLNNIDPNVRVLVSDTVSSEIVSIATNYFHGLNVDVINSGDYQNIQENTILIGNKRDVLVNSISSWPSGYKSGIIEVITTSNNFRPNTNLLITGTSSEETMQVLQDLFSGRISSLDLDKSKVVINYGEEPTDVITAMDILIMLTKIRNSQASPLQFLTLLQKYINQKA